jgi:hypothetical protein
VSGLRYDEAAAGKPPVATEKVGDDHFQLIKIVDATVGSVAPQGPIALASKQPNIVGTWSYKAATLTSGSLSATGKCQGILLFAAGGDASCKVNSGDTITVRSGIAMHISPNGNLVNPTVTWVSGTLDVILEVIA